MDSPVKPVRSSDLPPIISNDAFLSELEERSHFERISDAELSVCDENLDNCIFRLDEIDVSIDYAISPISVSQSNGRDEDIISHADAIGNDIMLMEGTVHPAQAVGEGAFVLNKNHNLEPSIYQVVGNHMSRLDGVEVSIDNAATSAVISSAVDYQLNRQIEHSIPQVDAAGREAPQAASLQHTATRVGGVEKTDRADDVDDTVPQSDERRDTVPCEASPGNNKTPLHANKIADGHAGLASASMNTALSTKPVGSSSSLRLSPLSRVFRNLTYEEIRQLFVIPEYLRLAMAVAVESKGTASREGFSASSCKSAPPYPLIVMINSKSGGHLGRALRSHLESLITKEQVHDLSVVSPMDFFRYGLGFMEDLAQCGDTCARDIRKRLRVLVAGGDGTVGWVLGVLAELYLEHDRPVPPLGIIPLGTGNDLARSFGWGRSFPHASRSAVKRYLFKATGSQIKPLDSWQVLVKALPNLCIDFPRALHSQVDAPISTKGLTFCKHSVPGRLCSEDIAMDGGTEVDKSIDTSLYEGVFYNYFSIGMDAQVAYGFHHLRNKAPFLARGPISNKLIYSGYSCTQGWFCTTCSVNPRARGLSNMMRMEIKHEQNSDWEPVKIPSKVRAVVFLNLQSYASGRNPWGTPSSKYNEKKGFVEPKSDDTLLEVFGLYDGWHSALVMINLLTAKRLAQACALRLELRGGRRHQAYMQMDGEPWLHPLTRTGEPTRLEITRVSKPSVMLVSA